MSLMILSDYCASYNRLKSPKVSPRELNNYEYNGTKYGLEKTWH